MIDPAAIKFCANCGTQSQLSVAFCEKCGTRFSLLNDQAEAEAGLTSAAGQTDLKSYLIARTDQEAPHSELAEINLRLAVLYLRREENAAALPYLEEAVRLDETNALAQAYLGAALAEEYQVDEAQSHLQRALELDSHSAVIHLKMAEFQLGLGLSVAAAEHLEIASKLDMPSRDTALYITNLLRNTRHRNRNIVPRDPKAPNLNFWKAWRNGAKAKPKKSSVLPVQPSGHK